VEVFRGQPIVEDDPVAHQRNLEQAQRWPGGHATTVGVHLHPLTYDWDYRGDRMVPVRPTRREKGADVLTSASLDLRDAVAGTTVELTADGRTMKVRIPAGVRDGQKIRLRGKGRAGLNGGENGDMVVTISIKKHPVYSVDPVDGANLRMDLPVTLREAALGATVEVPLLDGGTSKIKIKPGTSSGTVMRLRGKGATTRKKTGDLLVTIEVAVPKKLSKAAKKALEAFDEAMGDTDPRATLMEEAGT